MRLWSARIHGDIRLYLDGSEEPVYSGAAEEFFLNPYGPYLEHAGIAKETLDGTFYQRNASYSPIPFAERCRVVWVGNHEEIHFYETQIREYEEGTEVVSFSPDELKQAAGEIRRVSAVLKDIEGSWAYSEGEVLSEEGLVAAPGACVEAFEAGRPGAIERLTVMVKAPDIDSALRQCLLYVACDNCVPQVQSPVGDFFGAGPGVNPYLSVPFTVSSDGTMTSRYVMPFESRIKVMFENRSSEDVEVSLSALKTPWIGRMAARCISVLSGE